MHIGQKIRLLRVSQRLTQQQLAEKIHKERPLISHIERTGKIHHQTFLLICKALKVSPEQLEFASDEPFGAYKKESGNEIQLLKTEVERLKSELRLKDEIIQVMKAHLKEIKGQRKKE
jgi:transcriptional regulator with XRE-family HTH domain